MPLLRRCVAIAAGAAARSRTIVNLHAPITVSWLPAAAVPTARPASLDRSPIGACRRLDWIAAAAHGPASAAAARAGIAPLAPAATPPTFVRPEALRQARAVPLAARGERAKPAAVPRTALALVRPVAAAAGAFADTTARLTHRGRREELPVHTRPTALAPSPVAVAAAAVRAASAGSAAAPAPWAPPPSPPPAIDVTALTSQVMQQIDRRLVAYRERMGRV